MRPGSQDPRTSASGQDVRSAALRRVTSPAPIHGYAESGNEGVLAKAPRRLFSSGRSSARPQPPNIDGSD